MNIVIKGLKLLLVLVLTLQVQNAKAAHIVGGDVTYRFVRFNADTSTVTFRVNFTMYRDALSDGANFDTAAQTMFGVFREESPGIWTLDEQIEEINPTVPNNIEPNDDPCVEEPIGQVAVEEASYIFNVTLPIIDDNYLIVYQRCCRNETISNLIRPEDTGAAFDILITPEAQRLGNNSPVFSNYPPIFICGGFPIFVDQSAVDSDGDQLVYSFCSPFTAGGTRDAMGGVSPGTQGCCDCVRPNPSRCEPPFQTVQFRPPYTQLEPLGGNPTVTIDSDSGLITGTPEITGQFVVGVCVEEFRNGLSLGKIRRDFQFNVLECEKQVDAILDADDVLNDNQNTFVINACGDSTLTMKNLSTDINFIQSYEWTFYRGSELIHESSGGPEARDAEVVFPGIGQYYGTMILNKNIDCADTAFFEVNMYPAIYADFEFDYDTCIAGPVTFTDLSSTEGERLTGWEWDFDDLGNTSNEQNPVYDYETPGFKDASLIVTDNNLCKDTIVNPFSYQPAPAIIVVEPSSFIGCTPSEITLTNLSKPIDSTYYILWDLGDGNFSSDVSPTHTYLEEGNYNISLDIVSPIGCPISSSWDGWIRIKESPVADFDCSPDDPTALDRTVNFTDLTDIAGAWLWDFGGSGSTIVQNPTYTFPDTGIYKVLLTAYHPITNCPDTISKLIDVRPSVEFYFPNAFTPNADASNDLFLGAGYYPGLVDFRMSIWNRWGQMIFETTDPREGWNGREFNNGKSSPQGVYVFKAEYSDPRGNNFVKDGHVTLLR